ncbi:mRNA-binding protein NDAI_0G00180 [Naumovozyma dairenensis CBS 421]|uniref:RRM domain-containing protein n=1 Tax=Naumovozyma dairenensis (strain ATCC 10597 / BCRC 20456 / CBS 421 / NBRC 0211 / NRRL Y-12639) TaxID=1071378 RepID=G0WDD3_NAUDC|nr:hypothetical protein NDAI_0G00180 [Naumovozyma dairenensis CBS 421]CCD25794.2 hypothetical protein NDAI_0G00180 [Naumovozyma dairenensis CBS 421]
MSDDGQRSRPDDRRSYRSKPSNDSYVSSSRYDRPDRGYRNDNGYRRDDRRNDKRYDDHRGYHGSRDTGRFQRSGGRGRMDRRSDKGDYGPVLARELDSTYEEKVNRNYSNSIFVGNLTYDCTPEDLREYFSGIGEVVRADIITSKGHHRGMGTVEFTNSKDVEDAIRQYDGSYFLDRQIFVRQDNPPPDGGRSSRRSDESISSSRGYQDKSSSSYDRAPSTRQPNRQGYKVFIANLPFSINWQALKDMFKEFGDVLRADIELDSRGRSRGFGTVILREKSAMEKAIATLNGTEMEGRRIDVKEGYSNRQDPSDYKYGNDYRNDINTAPNHDQSRMDVDEDNQMPNIETEQNPVGARAIPTQPSYAPPILKNSTFTENVTGSGERNHLIYCNNLPASTARSDLYDLFESIGRISNAELKYNDKGEPTSEAVVEYINLEDADVCIERLNGYNYGGCELQISYGKRS